MNTTVNNNGAAESSVAATTETNPYLQPVLKEQAKAPTNGNALHDEAEQDAAADRTAEEQKLKQRRRRRTVKLVILTFLFASVVIGIALYRLRSTRVEYGQIGKQTQVLPPPPNATATTTRDSRSEQAIQDALRLTNDGNTTDRSHLRNQSEILRVDLNKQTESAQELKDLLDHRVDLYSNSDKRVPQSEFTEDKLDRLEANARFLRDPKMLQTAYSHFEQHYGETHQAIDKIGVRADKTLEFANASLAKIDVQIENFTDNREFFPVLFKTANGIEQTITLQDLAIQPAGESIVVRIFTGARSDRAAIDEALNQYYAYLRNERDAIQSFIKATSDLTESYREHLGTLNQVQAQESVAGSDVTARECLALKSPFDHVGPNSTTITRFPNDITAQNDPTQSGELKEITTITPQPNVDEHLKQIRQAIDNVSSANGAMNETGIEAGLADAEATASESLAALI